MGFIAKIFSLLALFLAFKAQEFYHPKVDNVVSNLVNIAMGLGDVIGIPVAPQRCNYKTDLPCVQRHRWLANRALELVTPPPELSDFAARVTVRNLRIPSSVTTGYEIEAVVALPLGWEGFSAAQKKVAPVVVYFHGGGFYSGNVAPDPIFFRLANDTAAVVVQVDYRVSPEERIDVVVQDCIDGLAHVVKLADDLGFSSENVNTAGVSAGGFLTISVGAWARRNGVKIKSQFVMIPAMIPYGGKTESFFEFHELKNVGGVQMAWFWNAFIQDYDCKVADSLCNPLDDDLTGSPPTVGKLGY